MPVTVTGNQHLLVTAGVRKPWKQLAMMEVHTVFGRAAGRAEAKGVAGMAQWYSTRLTHMFIPGNTHVTTHMYTHTQQTRKNKHTPETKYIHSSQNQNKSHLLRRLRQEVNLDYRMSSRPASEV